MVVDAGSTGMDLVMSIGDGYGGKSIDEYRDRARDGLLSAPTPP
jgi:hypothetical protein